MMKKLFTLCLAMATLIVFKTEAQADLAFLLSLSSVARMQGDTFTIMGDVRNTDPIGGTSYAVDNYALSVTPNTLSLPGDLNDDGTGFYTNFQRTFAPGDEVTQPFIDFTIGSSAAPGNYSVTVTLQDINNVGLAQQSFDLNISPSSSAVPEGGGVPLLVGCLLPLAGLAISRRRKCR